MPGIILIGLQRRPVREFRDQHSVIVAALHTPEDLTAFQLRDSSVKSLQASEEKVPLRLRAGAEFPHHDVPQHQTPRFAL